MRRERSSQAQCCNGQQNHIAKRLKLLPCNKSATLSPSASHIKREAMPRWFLRHEGASRSYVVSPSACSIVREITARLLKRYTDDS